MRPSRARRHWPSLPSISTCIRTRSRRWRGQLLEGATGVFGEGARADAAPAIDVKVLHAKIGELTLANDFLEVALGKAGLLASARR